ncbi:hypothetical protein ACFRFH_02230 [Leifsonia sp. NPDC056824]|uniref:hypothetical protein n=1 Tax=Leifsonia sp. NPDC056824 TaxID=3345953 RepID=UPI0036879017
MKKISVVAAASIVLVAALSGCSASTPARASKPTPTATSTAAAQTHAQACAIVMKTMKDLASKQGEAAAAMSDPSKAQQILDEMSASFASMDSGVTNPAVKVKTHAAAAAFTDYADYIKKVQADPSTVDTKVLTAKLTTLSDTSTAVGKECAAA